MTSTTTSRKRQPFILRTDDGPYYQGTAHVDGQWVLTFTTDRSAAFRFASARNAERFAIDNRLWHGSADIDPA